ncbi:helix-turn-helix transcriptional regulator [Flavobacteriaceae bacterium M23B6Z8]
MKHYIASNIHYVRKLKRLSQLEMGELLEVTQASQSAYEREKALPPLEYLIKLCSLYEIGLDNFVYKDLSKLDESEWKLVEVVSPKDKITEISGFKALLLEKENYIAHLKETNNLLKTLVEESKFVSQISDMNLKMEVLEERLTIVLEALSKAKLLKNMQGLQVLIKNMEHKKLDQKK